MDKRYADSHNPQGVQYQSGGQLPERNPQHLAVASPAINPLDLAEMVLTHRFVTPDELREAVRLTRLWNVQLGDVLIARGWIRPIDYHKLLAKRSGLPFVDLERHPPPNDLVQPRDITKYLTHGYIPVSTTDYYSNKRQVPLAVLSSASRQTPSHSPNAVATVVTTPRDVRNVILHFFTDRLLRRATSMLKNRAPWLSADKTMTLSQIVILICLISATLGGVWLRPEITLVTLNIILAGIFLSLIALRFMSAFLHVAPALPSRKLPPVKDRNLPVYTILVPLFREQRILRHLVYALRQLDYPAAKLDIKFIFEEEDSETLEAAKALDLPGNFEFLVAPKSFPQTKPKALNFALPFARGDYTVIYDAEDRPDPGQLRKAIDVFRTGPRNLACVQARLNFYNIWDNWLTRQFTIEYAALFDLLLPVLQRFRLPLPLGGTSNHFQTRYLRRVLGWDPYNVTEDADLGIRLARLGYETRMVDSTTYEEAACTLKPWLNQRSRWIKGWIQTYFVHMRNPFKLFSELGFRGFLAFQVFVGAMTISALVHPIFMALLVLGVLNGAFIDAFETWVGITLAALNALVLFAGYGVSIFAGAKAAKLHGGWKLALNALFLPGYWLLISLASYKALWQFFTQPFYWEKTEHGVSKSFRDEQSHPHVTP